MTAIIIIAIALFIATCLTIAKIVSRHQDHKGDSDE